MQEIIKNGVRIREFEGGIQIDILSRMLTQKQFDQFVIRRGIVKARIMLLKYLEEHPAFTPSEVALHHGWCRKWEQSEVDARRKQLTS